MPGKWVGGKGSLACPQKGQFIEAKVFDTGGKDQGTIIIEVKRLFGTGSSGRTILGDFVTASDEYYRWWTTTEDGKPTTEDGSYHLCKNDPTTCVGGTTEGTVVHLGKWRVWPEDELTSGKASHLPKEALTLLNRYFKSRGETEGRNAPGGLPWGEKPLDLRKTRKAEDEEKEDPKAKSKRQRISC